MAIAWVIFYSGWLGDWYHFQESFCSKFQHYSILSYPISTDCSLNVCIKRIPNRKRKVADHNNDVVEKFSLFLVLVLTLGYQNQNSTPSVIKILPPFKPRFSFLSSSLASPSASPTASAAFTLDYKEGVQF